MADRSKSDSVGKHDDKTSRYTPGTVRLIGVFFVFLCVAIGGSVLIGRGLPEASRLKMLHLEDCQLPCWIGIVPGTTSPSDADSRIQQAYHQPDYTIQHEPESVHVIRNQDGADLWVTLESDGAIVRRLTLSERDGNGVNPNIGELSRLLGRPTHFIVSPELGDTRVLHFTAIQVETRLDSWDVLNLPCDSVAVFRRVPFLVIGASLLPRSERATAWGGFEKCHHPK